MTAQDMITGALRLIGAYGATEIPEQEDLDDGLVTLNELINDWNANHLTIYTIVERQLGLVAGTQSYTIGAGGDFDYPRPVKIESAGIIQPNTLRSDLEILTSAQWARIPEKTASARLPLNLYNNNDYPLATLSVWPIPVGNCTLHLMVWDELSDGLLLGDALDLPPAYGRAIRYNLAIAMAPEYGITPDQATLTLATESRNELFGLNASNFAGTQDPPQPAAA